MFQACVSMAYSQREVVYIRKSPLTTLPLFVHNMPRPNGALLKLIKFKYDHV